MGCPWLGVLLRLTPLQSQSLVGSTRRAPALGAPSASSVTLVSLVSTLTLPPKFPVLSVELLRILILRKPTVDLGEVSGEVVGTQLGTGGG